MSRAALITGATGFIGGALARRLQDDGWSVHLLLRTAASSRLPAATEHLYTGSTGSVIAAVESARPDVVFHLASLYLADHVSGQVDDLIASNILLTAQIAEAMSTAGATRLVNAGTAWQHYQTASYRPVNLYAATKQAAQDILAYYHHARQLSVITLKLFDTYGVGDTRRKLVQLLIEAALSGEDLGLSPGEQEIDLTHVDDVVAAFAVAAQRLLATSQPLDEAFFVAHERQTVRDLVERVGRALGRPVPATFGVRPYREREVMQPTLPEPLLPGWQPERRLDDGIRQLAAGGGTT